MYCIAINTKQYPRLRQQVLMQMPAGKRIRVSDNLMGRTLKDDFATGFACTRSHIDNVICNGNHIGVILNNQDSITLISQLYEQSIQSLNIARMKPYTGFVKDIGEICQAASEVSHQFDTLRFSA